MPRTRKRTAEPIAPTNIPGERLDTKLPDTLIPPARDKPERHKDDPQDVEERPDDEGSSSDRKTGRAFDQAMTRFPPD